VSPGRVEAPASGYPTGNGQTTGKISGTNVANVALPKQ
jgi:hypothetical protein